MSSNAEQGPNAGLLARAKEAAKNPFLVEFGKRVPNPRQAPIIGEVLGLTLEERKNARAIAWLKKYQPATLQAILSEVSEAENKKRGGKNMRAVFMKLIGRVVTIYTVDLKYGGTRHLADGVVVKAGKEYVQLSGKDTLSGKPVDAFVKYDQIVEVLAPK